MDLRDYPLPHLDEPNRPSLGQYVNDHTKQWARKIASFDGFVMVTPEYNHATSGVLKNAIDYLYAEWNNKAVGFVSYGSVGGARAAEQLRLVCGALQMADVRQQVALSMLTEFENLSVFKPRDYNVAALHTLLDEVIAWSIALAPLRQTRGEPMTDSRWRARFSSLKGRARGPKLCAGDAPIIVVGLLPEIAWPNGAADRKGARDGARRPSLTALTALLLS